jgi:hypothetical protein
MRTVTRAALGCLTILLVASAAWASGNDDLTGLTNREYVEYARDRFEWLTGEARSGHRLAAKFHDDCKPGAPAESDAGRACEVAKAADEKNRQIKAEADELMRGLQQRLGAVPPWARSADAALIAVGH